jgi:hypothetical protein
VTAGMDGRALAGGERDAGQRRTGVVGSTCH